MKLYKTVDVLAEEFDEDEGPIIVAYRRRLKTNGTFEPKSEDDEYPIHIDNIVKMTDEYAKLHLEKASKKLIRS